LSTPGNEDEYGSHRDEASACDNALHGSARPSPNTGSKQVLAKKWIADSIVARIAAQQRNNATTQQLN
jgi:hypothetical protein